MKLPIILTNITSRIWKWGHGFVAAAFLVLFFGFVFIPVTGAEVATLVHGGQITLSGAATKNQIYPIGNGFILVSRQQETEDTENDLLLEKMTAEGKQEWSLVLPQSVDKKLELIQMVSNDIVVVLATPDQDGSTCRMLRLDSKGQIVWDKNLPLKKVNTMDTTNDDGLIIIGVKAAGIGQGSLVALKMDKDGVWDAEVGDVSRWQATLGNENYSHIYDVKQVLDESGYNDGYIMAGSKQMGGPNQKDAILIKLDTYGKLSWQQTYGRPGDNEALSVTPLREGSTLIGYAVAGYCTRSSGREMHLLHTGVLGNLTRWPGIDRAIDGDPEKFYGSGLDTIGIGVFPVPKSFDGGRNIGKESFAGHGGILLVGLQSQGTSVNLLIVRISEMGRDKWESQQNIPAATLKMGEDNQTSGDTLNVVYSSIVPDDLKMPITVYLLKLYMQNVSENDKTRSQTEVFSQRTEDMTWEKISFSYTVPADKATRTQDIKKLLAQQASPDGASPRTGRGEIEWPDNSYYLGNLGTGKADGEGTLFYTNGIWYKGTWKNNMFNGNGYLRFPSGEYYEGEFKDHLMQGKGIMKWPTGEKYEGDFHNNQRDGQGKFIWRDGTYYEGGFSEGVASGMGAIYWPSGERYEGQMEKGSATGQGSYYFPNGEYYRGEIKNLVFDGVGVYHWPDGSYYVGEFKQDRFNGEGYYVWPNGVQQHGYWKDDRYLGTNPEAVKARDKW